MNRKESVKAISKTNNIGNFSSSPRTNHRSWLPIDEECQRTNYKYEMFKPELLEKKRSQNMDKNEIQYDYYDPNI